MILRFDRNLRLSFSCSNYSFFKIFKDMPPKKNANFQQETEEEKWEKAYLTTTEKRYITETLHDMENVPAFNSLDVDSLRKLALNLCLHLKKRSPRWERFLIKKGNLKTNKFLKLEAYLMEILKKPLQQQISTQG